MRITKVDIPKSPDNKDGLESIKMDKLGSVVLLAGKNGSGKTRILNKISKTLSAKPTGLTILEVENQIKSLQVNIQSLERRIAEKEKALKTNGNKITGIAEEITVLKVDRETAKKNIENYNATVINWKLIETSEIANSYTTVSFVPKNTVLTDSSQLSDNEINERSVAICQKTGVEVLPQSTLAKIRTIQNRWFNATHPGFDFPKEEKQNAIEEYEKLEELVKYFLNTSLGRTINNETTLFDFPMGKANMSEGQNILLQFCLAIYSQETALKDLILIMDEPENHIHPSVLIETLDKIQEYISGGQIWIATHSVPLLAHYDPSSIWYVDNNKICHAGKIPEKVLDSLLGDEDEVGKLQDFIGLPAQYATTRYACDCLLEPQTAMTDREDPQSCQIRKELVPLIKNGKLQVLDYGAGKGRLILNIVDSSAQLIDKIYYIAYDKSKSDKECCENSICQVYGNCDKRYFNEKDQLISICGRKNFDVVIMCNVLHEIPPSDWLELFSANGLCSLLSDDGLLLLVEDHQMPIGEKAYSEGFLVLDTEQLKILFKIPENAIDFTEDKDKNGRLKAHKIPRKYLMQIDKGTCLGALRSLSKTAMEEITKIRNGCKNYKNGKLHGFWVQQFANANLSIDKLEKSRVDK